MISSDNLSKDELLSQIKNLKIELEEIKQEKADLEIMVESIAEHSSELNNLYFQKNQELFIYIEQVKKLAEAIQQIENNYFQPEVLKHIVSRKDELGKMAQVFLRISKNFQTG